MFDKPYYTCVIWSCSAQQAYILVTDDPDESLQQHNFGSYKVTIQQRPWKLLHTRKFGNYGDAKKWEDRLNTANQETRLFEVIGLDPAEL